MDQYPSPIGLLTDFGQHDWFVAAMKGEILKRQPRARIIDICHQVPAHQIQTGAFILGCVIDSMPPGSVFCCVVDPGVGMQRRAICGRVGAWQFVGPDNGLVTPLVERAGDDMALFQIERDAFHNEFISTTFHGRDLFAPTAALLAGGVNPAEAGDPVADPVTIRPNQPQEREDGIVGEVMLVDHFGNLVTNFRRRPFEERLAGRRYWIRAGALRLDTINRTFGEVRHVEALAYWESAGTLEIGVNLGSAAEVTGLKPGDKIFIEWLAR